MPSDTAGKQGVVHLGFEIDPRGYSILRKWERRAPLIVQQELYFDRGWPELPCVYILSSGGPNVEGDRYSHNIELKDKIREEYGESDMRNVIHSSDSYKNFTHESQVYFYNVNQEDLMQKSGK